MIIVAIVKAKDNAPEGMHYALVSRLSLPSGFGFVEKVEWHLELLEDAHAYAKTLVDHLRKGDPTIADYRVEL